MTSIGHSAFYGCSSLTGIEIPDGVTSIESSAFSGCSSLTSITIPSSVTSIGGSAFSGCSRLASIAIPSGLTSIGDDAFYGSNSLISIFIPSGVTSIGNRAFSGCGSLVSITFGDGSQLTSIGDYVFYNCSNLTSIEIPSGVTSIGGSAFSGCSSLTSIIIPDGVTSIGGSAFSGCSSLTSITIPDGVTSIEGNAFSGCSSLTNIKIPSGVTSIGGSAFSGCSSLASIEIPSGVTSIGDSAFYLCNKLYQIINLSNLQITIGGTDNGYVAYYAKVIIDKDGNRTYKDAGSGFTYVDTADDFRFIFENGAYTLIAYFGTKDTVTLPENINGRKYTIYRMQGVKNIILPNTMTSIGLEAFYDCSSLLSVVVPDSVTSIEQNAFGNCSNLISIILPDSITSISIGAFDNTAYYNDASNWENGCLYIGNHLIKVQEDAKYFVAKEDIGAIADDAFDGCYQLVLATIGGDNQSIFSSLTNLETLIVTEMPTSHRIYQYFDYYSSSTVPITLRTIVLKDSVQIRNSNLFYGITGVTIYVEANELDVMWDEDYPNWNNGNTVYYGGEWINATFCDIDGNILDSSYYLTSQVVRQPFYEIAPDMQYNYIMTGWDLDGDGIADSVPATSAQNISAYAVIEQSLRNYTVAFLDADGTPLYTYTLPYGTIIEAPSPVKTGYAFLGWEGYTDGMTVAGDISFTAIWQHDGDGHDYSITEVVEPTCTEQGYTKHICTICGEWYATDYVEASGHSFGELLTKEATCTEDGYTYYACMNCPYEEIVEGIPATGHNYGEWIIETAATCTADGLRYRVCEECGARVEETIVTIGHDYIGSVTKEPTCEEYGEITYTCRYCGDTVAERLDKTEHNYVKKYVPKSWLRWLVETLLNIFFGYEGNDGYYFECTDCRHIQTSEEALLASSVQSTCDHLLGEEGLALAATCEGQGVYGRYCTLCGELIEARTVDALGHEYATTIIAPTCSEYGYTLHTCSRCGDYYITDVVEKVAHTPGEAVRENEVAATCESAGSYETVIYCTECGAEISREETEIPALVHTEGEWIVDAEADCTHDGRCHKVCTVCGKLLETGTIEATGHNYGETLTVEATCETAGYTYHVCDACWHEEKLSDIPATGHTEGEWIVEVEADCTHDGSRHKVCAVCGKLLKTETIEAAGHSYGETLTVEATCETAGYTYHVCDACDYVERVSDIPATGHTSGEAVREHEVAAKCESVGSYEIVIYCTECGVEISREKTEIPALGHTPGEWIVDVEATETNEGERHIDCSICGKELLRETIPEIPVIPEPGISVGTVAAIAAGSAAGVGGCSGLLVWLILRKRRRI